MLKRNFQKSKFLRRLWRRWNTRAKKGFVTLLLYFLLLRNSLLHSLPLHNLLWSAVKGRKIGVHQVQSHQIWDSVFNALTPSSWRGECRLSACDIHMVRIWFVGILSSQYGFERGGDTAYTVLYLASGSVHEMRTRIPGLIGWDFVSSISTKISLWELARCE